MEYFLILLVQILLVVHVFKTGRNRMWVFLLIFVPLVGGVAYIAVEILPELFSGVSGQKAARGLRSTLDPGGDIRKQAAAFEHSPNADNARRYAGALLAAGQPDKAEEILEQVMTGLFRTDPNLLFLKARARFDLDDPASTARLLRELLVANPDFKSSEAHLLQARALESTGETQACLEEYRAVAGYFPGAEARYRLGEALLNAGQKGEALATFEQLQTDARHAPPHFRKAQRQWIKKAAAQVKSLQT